MDYSGSLYIYLKEMKQHFKECRENRRVEINDILNIVHPYSLLYDDIKKHSPFRNLASMFCEF